MTKDNLHKLLEEIILDFLDIWDNGFNKEDAAAIVNQWTKTPFGSRLIASLVEDIQIMILDKSVMETKMLFFKEALEEILNHDSSYGSSIASKALEKYK